MIGSIVFDVSGTVRFACHGKFSDVAFSVTASQTFVLRLRSNIIATVLSSISQKETFRELEIVMYSDKVISVYNSSKSPKNIHNKSGKYRDRS